MCLVNLSFAAVDHGVFESSWMSGKLDCERCSSRNWRFYGLCVHCRSSDRERKNALFRQNVLHFDWRLRNVSGK